MRNLSDWVDAKPFMKVFVNELPASDEDIAQIEGLNQGLCLRLCLLPMGPDSFTLQVEKEEGNTRADTLFMLQVFYVPRSLAKLEEMTKKKKIPLSSLSIPSCRLYHGSQPALSIKTFPVEQAGAGIGLGLLPLLECVRGDPEKLPTRDEIDRELADLLGARVFFISPVSDPAALEKAWEEEKWAPRVMENKPIYWPAFQGSTTGEDTPSGE